MEREGEGHVSKKFSKGGQLSTDPSLSPIDPVALSGAQEGRPKRASRRDDSMAKVCARHRREAPGGGKTPAIYPDDP